MKIPVLVLEDQETSLQASVKVIREFQHFFELIFDSGDFINSIQKFTEIRGKLESLTGDLVLVVDLGYDFSDSDYNETVLPLAKRFGIDLLSSDRVPGLALTKVAIMNNNIRRLLFCPATSRGFPEQYVRELLGLQRNEPFPNRFSWVPNSSNLGDMDTDSIRDLFLKIMTEWQRKWPDYHTDPAINKALAMFGAPWEHNTPNGHGTFNPTKFHWSHDDIQSNSSEYKSQLEKWLEVKIDDASAKCLAMLSERAGESMLVAGEFHRQHVALPQERASWVGTWHDWNWQNGPGYGHPKTLSKDALDATLRAFEIQADVTIQNGNRWMAPVVPALTFFTALAAFLAKLKSPEEGSSPAKKVTFSQTAYEDTGILGTVLIELARSRVFDNDNRSTYPFGLSSQFWAVSGTPGSVREALRELLFCRTVGIHRNATNLWLQVFRGETSSPQSPFNHPSPPLGLWCGPSHVMLTWIG